MDVEKLEKLAALKEKGILTQKEFDEQKKILLSEEDERPKTKNSGKSRRSKTVSDSDDGDLSLWEYFVKCTFEKYASFKGRARRKEFFGFYLFYILISFVIQLFVALVSGGNPEAVQIIGWLISLFMFLPILGVTVRRLHDVNYSGWWAASPYVMVFFVISAMLLQTPVLMVFAVLAFLISFVPLVAFFFKSDMEENDYGEVPAGVIE